MAIAMASATTLGLACHVPNPIGGILAPLFNSKYWTLSFAIWSISQVMCVKWPGAVSDHWPFNLWRDEIEFAGRWQKFSYSWKEIGKKSLGEKPIICGDRIRNNNMWFRLFPPPNFGHLKFDYYYKFLIFKSLKHWVFWYSLNNHFQQNSTLFWRDLKME